MTFPVELCAPGVERRARHTQQPAPPTRPDRWPSPPRSPRTGRLRVRPGEEGRAFSGTHSPSGADSPPAPTPPTEPAQPDPPAAPAADEPAATPPPSPQRPIANTQIPGHLTGLPVSITIATASALNCALNFRRRTDTGHILSSREALSKISRTPHIDAVDLALVQLPALERGQGLICTDSGGSSKALLAHLTELGLEYSIGFPAHETVRP